MTTESLTIIGTLHARLTPHQELSAVLEAQEPEMLFIEIAQKDIDTGNLEHYPDEMVAACEWAQSKHIPLAGFDVEIEVHKPGITAEQKAAALASQNIILSHHSWQEANQLSVIKKLRTPEFVNVIDANKWQLRELHMLNIIQDMRDPQIRTVLLTGVAHLPFFQKHFSEAIFPFY